MKRAERKGGAGVLLYGSRSAFGEGRDCGMIEIDEVLGDGNSYRYGGQSGSAAMEVYPSRLPETH